MRRLAPALLLLACTGCTEQEPVPLVRSVPVALLLAAVPVYAVVGAWRSLARDERPRRAVPPWRAGVALGLVAPAILALYVAASGVVDVGFGWTGVRYEVLSWGESAVVAGVFVVLAGLLIRFQIAAVAAVVHDDPWGVVVAAGEVLLLAFVVS